MDIFENTEDPVSKTPSQPAPLLEEKAQHALWAALRQGTLRGGQFLSMSQLVDILGCPIAATRDAVKQASALGLVTTLPKRGIQVMDVNFVAIRESLDFRMLLDQEGARRRIAARSLDGLDRLRDRHDHLWQEANTEGAGDLPPRAIETDLSLHDFLADGLENAQLSAAYDVNRVRIAIIQNIRPFLKDRIASAMQEHLAIIDALGRCDVDATELAIRYHYDQTLRWWGVPA
ncbi:GntR family transcriptional regulator [Marivita sp. S0852]|uniref:GntR family transcriptional regulator n=1 Tax=Marivita sp. S0852 TaxID=3373893 RepID=UPI0039825301